MVLQWTDHRQDPQAWADSLGVSRAAVDLTIDAHFIDLHCCMELGGRLIGYDPSRRHSPPTRVRPLLGHTDYPRVREARMTGVVYDVTTNPFRPRQSRFNTTLTNIERAIEALEQHPEEQAFVTTRSGYDAAVAEGRTAYWLSLQGGNALSADLSVLDGAVGDHLHRVTLVHLTNSDLGCTNSPQGATSGITDLGRSMVAACNANRVIVDLAHSSKQTFWDALDTQRDDVPPIVSHTGIEAVRPHWRNIDDDQIRAIADRGGVVGVMYQSSFLAPVRWACARARIVDHLGSICDLVGDQYAAIGTDYDGFIVPPHDLLDVTHHPLLVQDMLDRGWTEARIRRILGENYLRVVAEVCP